MTYIITDFNLNDHLKKHKVIAEHLHDIDGSTYEVQHKEVKLGEQLTLYLYDSGQATVEYRGHEAETFMWDEEAAELFENFHLVRAVDLFEIVYRKRWVGIYDEK